jgi:hypothetical protein
LELVSRALDRAETLGDDCSGAVKNAFYSIAATGVKLTTMGEPCLEDIALRDRCRDVLPQLPVGGAAYHLLREVLNWAEQIFYIPVEEDEE